MPVTLHSGATRLDRRRGAIPRGRARRVRTATQDAARGARQDRPRGRHRASGDRSGRAVARRCRSRSLPRLANAARRSRRDNARCPSCPKSRRFAAGSTAGCAGRASLASRFASRGLRRVVDEEALRALVGRQDRGDRPSREVPSRRRRRRRRMAHASRHVGSSAARCRRMPRRGARARAHRVRAVDQKPRRWSAPLVATCPDRTSCQAGSAGHRSLPSARRDRSRRSRTAPAEHPAKLALCYRDPRRFGWMRVARAEELGELAGLGPEPLNGRLRAETLRARLRGTRRDVKAALLDQRVLAGIGNIYANEILFHAGVRPTRRCTRLRSAEIDAIVRATRSVLGDAVARRGTSFSDYFDSDGLPGSFQEVLAVFDRAGQPCRRCNSAIKRRPHGGRSSFYCPRCQR